MSSLKIEQFVEQHFGIKLTQPQLEMIALMAANPEKRFVIGNTGRSAGKTTAYKAAMAYLQDGMKPAADPFDFVEPCEENCSPERHAYHQGQWDMATRMSDGVPPSVDTVDRFEVIDHRQCVYCRGRCKANYLQKDGSYKEQPCDKCDGSGMRGGRVYGAFSNPETSTIKVELSYQDDGKTLKVFVSDK